MWSKGLGNLGVDCCKALVSLPGTVEEGGRGHRCCEASCEPGTRDLAARGAESEMPLGRRD